VENGDLWRHLGENEDSERVLQYPVANTKLQLEDLMVLGIVNRKIEAETQEDEDDHYRKQETTPYFWKLSEKCQELIRTSEIYDVEDDSWEFGEERVDLNK